MSILTEVRIAMMLLLLVFGASAVIVSLAWVGVI